MSQFQIPRGEEIQENRAAAEVDGGDPEDSMCRYVCTVKELKAPISTHMCPAQSLGLLWRITKTLKGCRERPLTIEGQDLKLHWVKAQNLHWKPVGAWEVSTAHHSVPLSSVL